MIPQTNREERFAVVSNLEPSKETWVSRFLMPMSGTTLPQTIQPQRRPVSRGLVFLHRHLVRRLALDLHRIAVALLRLQIRYVIDLFYAPMIDRTKLLVPTRGMAGLFLEKGGEQFCGEKVDSM